MRQISTCTLLSVLGVLGLPQTTGAQTTGKPCPQRHSQVIQANRQAVIYEGLNSERLYEVFGCVRGGRKAYVLGMKAGFSSDGGGGVDRETLAGTTVAYEESLVVESRPPYSPRRARFVVVVRDLRTGRVLRKVPTGPSSANQVGAGATAVIVVKGDGAVAWINGAQGYPQDEVRAADKAGARLLASGPGIDTHSLRLKGSTLSWVQNGATASAPLD